MLMRSVLLCLLSCWTLLAQGSPNVVVSIKPIHDLTAALMEGVAEPTLLTPPGASPHTYALKPSQMIALDKADLIIWIGPEMETFLTKMVMKNPEKALTLIDTAGLIVYPLPGSTYPDPHVWMSPENASILVQALSKRLATLDPAHTAIYQRNEALTLDRIARLERQVIEKIEPIRMKPYMVFHDGYQYFDRHFKTHDVGSLVINPDVSPSAARIMHINETLKKNNVRCIFSEPQFKPALIKQIAEQTGVKTGVLDPIGADSETGMAAYESLLNHMADDLSRCLK